jgi:hypothetical protein
VEIRKIIVRGQPRQKVYEIPISANKAGQGDVCVSSQLCEIAQGVQDPIQAEDMTQVVEYLPAPGPEFNPQYDKKGGGKYL